MKFFGSQCRSVTNAIAETYSPILQQICKITITFDRLFWLIQYNCAPIFGDECTHITHTNFRGQGRPCVACPNVEGHVVWICQCGCWSCALSDANKHNPA